MKDRFNLRYVAMLVLWLGVLLLTGCATTDGENISERPWNSPKTWESGLPSNINEGR
jgi:hypothetical protein